MPKIPYDPETEIIGQVLLAYINNLQSDIIKPVMEKHSMGDIQPDEWYPLHYLMDMMDELSKRPNYSSNMIAVGMKVGEYAVSPVELADISLGEIFEMWNEHMYANHRNGDIGKITTEKVNDKFYRTIHTNVYPDDLMYGLAFSFAQVKLPRGTAFKVWYENEDHRRDHGDGEDTVICISWE